jgi:exopolyphosphatase/guanosine-5'-triphosphate,3'-diphosphate pyrophosphatase
MVLRMAVALCHARRDPDLKGITLRRDPKSTRHFTLSLSNEWAKLFPQSAYLLNEESVAWQKTPWSLDVSVV